MYSHRIEIGGLGDVFSSDTFATTTYDKDGTLSFTSPSTTEDGDDVFDAYPGKFNTLVAILYSAVKNRYVYVVDTPILILFVF